MQCQPPRSNQPAFSPALERSIDRSLAALRLAPLAPIGELATHPRLFALEAGDRAGKTTAIGNIVRVLGAFELDVRVFREPGGSPRAEEIRAILKNPASGLTSAEQTELFFAAREDLVRTTLLPWLEQDPCRVALLDRYFWSTIVYQGLVGGFPLPRLAELVTSVCAGAVPVQTYFLDLDPEVADARVRALGADADVDAADLASIEYKRSLRDGYADLCEQFPTLISRIDAGAPPRALGTEIAAAILGRLGQ